MGSLSRIDFDSFIGKIRGYGAWKGLEIRLKHRKVPSTIGDPSQILITYEFRDFMCVDGIDEGEEGSYVETLENAIRYSFVDKYGFEVSNVDLSATEGTFLIKDRLEGYSTEEDSGEEQLGDNFDFGANVEKGSLLTSEETFLRYFEEIKLDAREVLGGMDSVSEENKEPYEDRINFLHFVKGIEMEDHKGMCGALYSLGSLYQEGGGRDVRRYKKDEKKLTAEYVKRASAVINRLKNAFGIEGIR